MPGGKTDDKKAVRADADKALLRAKNHMHVERELETPDSVFKVMLASAVRLEVINLVATKAKILLMRLKAKQKQLLKESSNGKATRISNELKSPAKPAEKITELNKMLDDLPEKLKALYKELDKCIQEFNPAMQAIAGDLATTLGEKPADVLPRVNQVAEMTTRTRNMEAQARGKLSNEQRHRVNLLPSLSALTLFGKPVTPSETKASEDKLVTAANQIDERVTQIVHLRVTIAEHEEALSKEIDALPAEERAEAQQHSDRLHEALQPNLEPNLTLQEPTPQEEQVGAELQEKDTNSHSSPTPFDTNCQP